MRVLPLIIFVSVASLPLSGRGEPPPRTDDASIVACASLNAALRRVDGALEMAHGAFNVNARDSMSQKVCRDRAPDLAEGAGALGVVKEVAGIANSLANKSGTAPKLSGDFALSRETLRKLAEQDCSSDRLAREKRWKEAVAVVRKEVSAAATACAIDTHQMSALFEP